ncbi:hypothetical protein GALMADRAFT_148562 [Galerina marginata CBS 339.88]|uniref:RNase H type-1 domain-containing protein n=1 Tax=Galerina marginata (strain CBS 339.88) TaxID=685588 RepID=A0A067S450_GALM3|nr:hypothetical protein GALMADRAFT_148562 [Galerina marginata CBS 339.88]
MDIVKRLPKLTERLEPMASIAQPGRRLRDKFWSRVHFDDSLAPLEKEDRSLYLDFISDMFMSDTWGLCIGVDASVFTNPASKKATQAVAAGVLYSQGVEVNRFRWLVGHATAPDAEMSAICRAIGLATKRICEHIAIFTDSIAMAKRALDPSLHSSQSHSLLACKALEAWLADDPLRWISFHHVPSKLKWGMQYEAHQHAAGAYHRPVTSSYIVFHFSNQQSLPSDWKRVQFHIKFMTSLHFDSDCKSLVQDGPEFVKAINFAIANGILPPLLFPSLINIYLNITSSQSPIDSILPYLQLSNLQSITSSSNLLVYSASTIQFLNHISSTISSFHILTLSLCEGDQLVWRSFSQWALLKDLTIYINTIENIEFYQALSNLPSLTNLSTIFRPLGPQSTQSGLDFLLPNSLLFNHLLTLKVDVLYFDTARDFLSSFQRQPLLYQVLVTFEEEIPTEDCLVRLYCIFDDILVL